MGNELKEIEGIVNHFELITGYGGEFNLSDKEKLASDILDWHNSRQLTEGEIEDLLAKALYFKMGCHYEVDAKYYAKVLIKARESK